MITKVKDLPYRRYTIEEGKAAYAAFCDAMGKATCVDDVLDAKAAFVRECLHYQTFSSLANCRFTLNTRDTFYSSEVDYYDAAGPEFSELMLGYAIALLDSPFRAELDRVLNPQLIKSLEVQRRAFSPLVTEECKKENALVTSYSKFMSETVYHYDGKDMPLSVLRGYLSHADRNVRRAAAVAIDRGLSENGAELDRIYDELVKIRTTIARKMGYADFVELGYCRMGRTGYNREMVENFRANVRRDLVPVVRQLKEGLAEKFSWSEVTLYDDSTYSPTAPTLILDRDGIFAQAQKMYDSMSTVTGSFMREMLAAEAFDVDARDGKWGGGYCTGFADFKQPFILANFNGTDDDIGVITHEFGHALAAHFVYTEGDIELDVGGMETAECHSMSMEFFTDRYMEAFFGKTADAYREKHLLDALTFIPYGCMVDEFQHEVYSHPEMTPAERKATWAKLEKTYRPYMSFRDLPYLAEGTRWQYQMHIYESPFYYIDYCLAQTVALGFFLKSRKDYEGAFADYIAFARRGGTVAFADLVRDAGIPSPFEDGSLAGMAKEILPVARALAAKE